MNTKHNDGSEIAELMQCLLEPVVTNPKFPALAKELQAEKGNVKGDESMCKLVEEYGERQKAEGVLETLVSLAKKKLLTYDEAAKEANMSKSEFMKLVQG